MPSTTLMNQWGFISQYILEEIGKSATIIKFRIRRAHEQAESLVLSNYYSSLLER